MPNIFTPGHPRAGQPHSRWRYMNILRGALFLLLPCSCNDHSPHLNFFELFPRPCNNRTFPNQPLILSNCFFVGPNGTLSHRFAARQTTLGQQLYKRHVSGDKNRWAIIDSSIHPSTSRKSSLNRSRQRHEIPSPGSEKAGDVT